MTLVISAHTRVTLFFSLALADGQLIDGNFGQQAASFVPGDGSLLPGFESLLFGLKAGDKQQFLIKAADAFGERKEANLQRIARKQFADDMTLTPGLVVSFAAREGGELPGVVHRVMGDKVEIDFNHPLAGRDIVFDVDIVAVEMVADKIDDTEPVTEDRSAAKMKPVTLTGES